MIFPDFTPSQTSVPDWLMSYCSQLADVHYQRKLNRMYVHMLQGFLAYEPWNANPPFAWRVARTHKSSGMHESRKTATDPGWVAMNMMVPVQLHNEIKTRIELINMNATDASRKLSLRTFLYSAVYWWVTSVYPYKGPGMLEN
jgi:hypothetical protein